MQLKETYRPAKALGAVFLIFIVTAFLDRDVQEGMFFDGVTYAAISRNLAIGKGDFWNLYFRGTGAFTGHPPLMFWLQSWFFWLLGHHFFTEKVFCLVVWLVTMLQMRQLWACISKEENHRAAFAFMLLGWGIMPTVMWSYPNNLLDSMMGIFDLAAVMLIYRALVTGRQLYPRMALAGLLVFLAVFTKGPVGLFPLSMPLLYWLVYRTGFGKSLYSTVAMVLVVIAVFYVLLLFPAAKLGLLRYYNEQIVASIDGKTDVTGGAMGRFAIFSDLLGQLLPTMVLVGLVLVIAKLVKKHWYLPNDKKPVWLFLLLGICASVPIAFSVKQRSFYLIPSLPYYAIGLGLLGAPAFTALAAAVSIKVSTKKVLNALLVGIALGAGIYVASRVGKIGREEDLVGDMKTIQKYIPPETVVGICGELDNDFSFLSYMERYGRLEVTTNFAVANYVLSDKNLCGEAFATRLDSLGYTRLPYAFNRYILFRKKQ